MALPRTGYRGHSRRDRHHDGVSRCLLTCLHLYEKLAKYAGAGTIVPITGFANAIVSPAMEFKSEGFILGLGAKLFVIAGPVLVYGISASVIYGLILFLTGGGSV